MTEFQVSHFVNWAIEGSIDNLPSEMKWTSEDPVAVHISFGGQGGGNVDWSFARDLLADVVSGKHEATGQGDVSVTRQPSIGLFGASRDQLILTLAVGHTVRLRTDMEEIRIFLQNTYIYAPQGEEKLDSVVDAAIGKLLGGGWASGV